jgi:hypothetical protein
VKNFVESKGRPFVGAYQIAINDRQGRLPWDVDYEDDMKVFPVVTRVRPPNNLQ